VRFKYNMNEINIEHLPQSQICDSYSTIEPMDTRIVPFELRAYLFYPFNQIIDD